jgi:plastocyanin
MRRWTIVTVIALAMGARAVSLMSQVEPIGAPSASTVAAAAAATENQVEIDNFVFKPKEVTIAVGGKGTWVNKDDVPHTATSSDDPAVFDSKALDTDDKYSFTFTKPGTYKYFCKVHPHMTGVVIVK